MTGRRDSLWGRRKGKPLSARRVDLMATRFPLLVIDTETVAPVDLLGLFPVPVKSVCLEIGFGGGEHLVHEARNCPEIGFIGVEPFLNGMAKAVASIVDASLENVRLFAGDASILLDWLPPTSLRRIDLLYPDPWPKKRHHKRRLIQPAFLTTLASRMVPGGRLALSTDWEEYAVHMLEVIDPHPDFDNLSPSGDYAPQPENWTTTSFEKKGRAAGRAIFHLLFARRAGGNGAGDGA